MITETRYDIMGVETTAPVKPPQKLTFWGKTKLAVREFFEGAVAAAPNALLFAAIALAASATMGHTFGFNPLSVGEFNTALIGRWVGIGLISSGISGVFHSVEVLNHSDEAPKSGAPAGKVKAAGGEVQEVSYGVSPLRTPPGTKLGNNVSRQHL